MSADWTVKRKLMPALPPEFYSRLIEFYRRQPKEGEHFSPLWQFIIDGFQKPLLEALEAGEVAPLANVLGNLYGNKVMYGLDSSLQGLDEYDLRLGNPEHFTEEFFQTQCLQLLHVAAVSLGTMPMFNPEQEKEETVDSDADLAAVEEALGCTLDHPGAGNVSGLCHGEQFIPHKLLDAACVMASVRRLHNWDARAVLEIGAGAGWMGYLLNRMGFLDYYTLDLPLVSVIQAYMLAAALSPSRVWLAGEGFPKRSCEAFICGLFLEAHTFPYFSLAINQNSFPELSAAQQDVYVALLGQVVQSGGYFFSVNHEASINDQNRTFLAFSKSPDFRLIQRSPCWARAGYVEEVWQRV